MSKGLHFKNEKEFQVWYDSIKKMNQSSEESTFTSPFDTPPVSKRRVHFDSERKKYEIKNTPEEEYYEYPIEEIALVLVSLALICWALSYLW